MGVLIVGMNRNHETKLCGFLFEVHREFNLFFYQFLQKLAAPLTMTFFNFIPALC